MTKDQIEKLFKILGKLFKITQDCEDFYTKLELDNVKYDLVEVLRELNNSDIDQRQSEKVISEKEYDEIWSVFYELEKRIDSLENNEPTK